MTRRSAITRLLLDGGVIAPFSYAPGYPAFMPHGVRVLDRLRMTYEEELRRSFAIEKAEPPLLMDAEAYAHSFGASHDYANVYVTSSHGRDCAVRPDGLTHLAARQRLDTSVVSHAPLFRAETADPQPLVRDRHIESATQVVHQVADGDPGTVLKAHGLVLREWMRRLLLPTLVVECGPLRAHAQQRWLTFSLSHQGHLWLTSTLYHLDASLVTAVGGTGSLVEVGFTAKLLALSASLHHDGAGMRLPRALSPMEALTVGSPGFTETVATMGVRCEPHDSDWDGARKRARGVGIPIAAAESGEHVRCYERVLDGGSPVPATQAPAAVTAALRNHDDDLWEQALAWQRPLFLEGDGPCEVQHPREIGNGWHILGRVVDANFARGREAAARGHVLASVKPRLY